jgi:hypothetical protein
MMNQGRDWTRAYMLCQRLRTSKLPASSNNDIAVRFIVLIPLRCLNLAQYIHTIQDLAENNVLLLG